MRRSSTGPRWSGSLLILGTLLIVLAACLLTLQENRPAFTVPVTSSSRFPAGHTQAEPAELVGGTSAAPAQAKKPNIVTILTDDMRADDIRWMPNVRRLIGARGLTFHNSFSPFPLCCPARASLLSGEYAHNHHVYSHLPPYGFRAFDDARTIATSLNSSGYNTVFLGKYLNGYGVQPVHGTRRRESFTYVPPGWTEWRAAVSRPASSGYRTGGTYNYFHTIFNVDGKIDDTHKGQYQTNVLGRMADRMVRKYHRSPKPFYLYLSPVAPHMGGPREKDDPQGITFGDTGRKERIKTPARPRSVWGKFDQQIPRASGLPTDGGPSEADVSDKPRPMDALPELSAQERTAVRTLTRQRAEALSVVDDQVGKLVQTLKDTGEYDNTVIMFTSDNGYFLGEHRMRQGKIKPHEPSLRVPFLIAGPGVPHGQRYDPVTTPGVSATIVQLAGATPPHPTDGLSLVRSFRRDRGWTAPVVTEGMESSKVFKGDRDYWAPGFRDPRTTIGIRTARWVYVRYNDGDGELYDLDKDAAEMDNRFGDPRLATVQRELARVWGEYKDCRGQTCRAGLPAELRHDAAQETASTRTQVAQVQKRYGYGY